jgi:hypothetical protein
MTEPYKTTIERKISFTVPNTIGLKSEEWDKSPVGFHVSEIPLYCAWSVGILLAPIFIFLSFNMASVLLWIGLGVAIYSTGYYLERKLKRKHREKQLRYRKEYAPALIELLEANGFTISEEEQHALASTMKSKLKVLKDGVKYRSSGLETFGDSISATFFLVDTNAQQALLQTEHENKIQNIVTSYEAEHGEFATPELRAAFLSGVRQALR